MPRNATHTRDLIIRAAERLWAERGIDAVSLNQINQAAGQRNASALHYHFGGKEELLRAVLARHQPSIQAAREPELARLEAEDCTDLRALIAAIVRPIAEHARTAPGGAAFVSIMAQLTANPGGPTAALPDGPARTAIRLEPLVRRASRHVPRELFNARAVLMSMTMFGGLRFLSLVPDRIAAVENLIDCLTALVAAPVDVAALECLAVADA